MKCKRLISTLNLPKEEWLKVRKLGITGTNVSALAGVNDYASAVDIYLEKINAEVEEKPDNEYMEFGRILEPVVADYFKAKHPEYKIKRINAVLQHNEYDWVLGDIDRLIINDKGEEGILEIKTGTEYSISKWEEEKVPDAYMVQLQWYMFLTGTKYGYFGVLLGGHRYVEKYVERDEELINYLFEIAKDFWLNKIPNKIMPTVDGSSASTDILKKMYPQAETRSIRLDNEAEILVIEREQLKEQIKTLETQLNEKENKLKAYLQDAESGETDDYIVSWKNVKGRETFDSKALKADFPQIAVNYIKHGEPSRKFEIKRRK